VNTLKKEILDKIRFYLATDEIKIGDDLLDYACDSLDVFELYTALEKDYDINFDRMYETKVKVIIDTTLYKTIERINK